MWLKYVAGKAQQHTKEMNNAWDVLTENIEYCYSYHLKWLWKCTGWKENPIHMFLQCQSNSFLYETFSTSHFQRFYYLYYQLSIIYYEGTIKRHSTLKEVEKVWVSQWISLFALILGVCVSRLGLHHHTNMAFIFTMPHRYGIWEDRQA